MLNTEKTPEILNDLIKINNDRIAGYERAITETRDLDIDLKATFESMIQESGRYKDELKEKVHEAGAEAEEGTTLSGKIYRAWMDVKATFTGKDRQAILDSCEFGEDAAQRAYDAALNANDAEMNTDIRELISQQQQALKNSHDLIKKYRDAHKAAR
jgi:uncharacterized protein (TIGR02284 family)